jgi:hypothetical protein
MSEKVTLPKEVAEAIESVKEFYTNAEIIGTIITDRGCTAYGSEMDDLLGALEIEWMKREAERMDRQVREMLKRDEEETE